jgi:hypothetical protein
MSVEVKSQMYKFHPRRMKTKARHPSVSLHDLESVGGLHFWPQGGTRRNSAAGSGLNNG